MISNYRERNSSFNTVLLVMLLLPLIVPDYLQRFSGYNTLTSVLTILLLTILTITTFLKRRFNFFIILSVIFIVWRIIASYYIVQGPSDINNSLKILVLILLVNITIKNNTKAILNALSIVFGFYIIINFITIILYPGGLYIDNPRIGQFRSAWFLGIDNQFALIIIPGIIISVLSSLYNYSKISWKSWTVISIASITIIKTMSATALVAIFFVLISIILNVKKRSRPLYSFAVLSIIYIILWIMLVRLNSISFFQTIVIDLLGKDLTLSGRTRIWDVVFNVIPESLWYGHGINVRVLVSHTYFVAHNMILQTTLESGIIGLLLFILCILIAGLMLTKYKKSSITVLLVIGIFGILIGGLTEAYRFNYLFMLLCLSFNVKYLLKKDRKLEV